jgi:hypothetical protein
MPSISTLKNVAMALGVSSGLIEIFLAATTVAAVGRSANYVGFMIYVVPLLIIAGGLAIRLYPDSALGTGVVLNGIAIQHVLVEIKPIHYLPIILAVLAVIIGLYLPEHLSARSDAPARTHRPVPSA